MVKNKSIGFVIVIFTPKTIHYFKSLFKMILNRIGAFHVDYCKLYMKIAKKLRLTKISLGMTKTVVWIVYTHTAVMSWDAYWWHIIFRVYAIFFFSLTRNAQTWKCVSIESVRKLTNQIHFFLPLVWFFPFKFWSHFLKKA